MTMRYDSIKYSALVGSSMAAMFVAGPVQAQDDGGTALSSVIVVTARGQEEALIDVPVSVSALTADQLDSQGASNLDEISQLVPELSIAPFSNGGLGEIRIRGIGTSPIDASLEQSVNVSVDGIQVGRASIVRAAFFDLEQVAILKGPQALFFGRNSSAGVVSLQSAGASKNLEGYLRGGYEFIANERFVEGAIAGPLGNTLGARVAVRAEGMEGWIRNNAPAQPFPFFPNAIQPGAADRLSPGTSQLTGRFTLEWEPSSDFSAALRLLGTQYKDNDSNGNVQVICFAPTMVPTTAGRLDPTNDCQLDRNKSTGVELPQFIANEEIYFGVRDGRPYTDMEAGLASLELNYHAGPITLTSLTGIYAVNFDSASGFRYESFVTSYGSILEDYEQFSQEFRAVSNFDAPLNFTAGAFYSSTEMDSYVNVRAGGTVFYDPVNNVYHGFNRESHNKSETISVFGQLRYKPVPSIEIAGGLRWTEDQKSSTSFNTYRNPNFAAPLLPVGQAVEGSFTDHDVSAEATVSWQPNPDMLVYAAYREGYKSGGFVNPTFLSTSFNNDNIKYDAETARGGELGFKADLLDRSLHVELTGYLYDYNNLQVSSFITVGQFGLFLVNNAATTKIRGLEGVVNWKATPELTIGGSLAYNHARYGTFENVQCNQAQRAVLGASCLQSLSGQQPVRSPDYSGRFSVDYDTPITSNLRIGANASVEYSGSYFTNDNNDPLTRQGSFARFNASLRLHDEDDNWQVDLIGRNLNNEYYLTVTNDNTGGGLNQYSAAMGRVRQIVLQGTVRF